MDKSAIFVINIVYLTFIERLSTTLGKSIEFLISDSLYIHVKLVMIIGEDSMVIQQIQGIVNMHACTYACTTTRCMYVCMYVCMSKTARTHCFLSDNKLLWAFLIAGSRVLYATHDLVEWCGTFVLTLSSLRFWNELSHPWIWTCPLMQ